MRYTSYTIHTVKLVIISKSGKETRKIAGELALKIMKSPTSPPSMHKAMEGQKKLRRASVITLEGELGAGKTTFAKGFAKALGVKVKVKSPTFVLMKKYNLETRGKRQGARVKYLCHLDCYRARDHRDLATLDLKSLFKSPENIILIEWPERVSKILPKKLIRVHIDHLNKKERKIQIFMK